MTGFRILACSCFVISLLLFSIVLMFRNYFLSDLNVFGNIIKIGWAFNISGWVFVIIDLIKYLS